MTYGPVRKKKQIEKKEMVFGKRSGAGGDASKAADDERNDKIRARHGKKRAPKEEAAPLIDGNNVIFADKELKELAERDIGSARDHLIERMVNYAGYTGIEVKVVFDAYKVVPGDGSVEEHDGVDVIYTAANEPADIRIGKMIREARGRRIYSVSSDNLVQQDAWAKDAMRISSREFMDIVRQAEDEIRERLRG